MSKRNYSGAVDRELFHSWLWYHRDGRGFVKGTQKTLAVTLDVTPSTMSRLFNELMSAGKLIKHGHRWRVVDPEETSILDY
jgi:CRP-like cAMP-binding protein